MALFYNDTREFSPEALEELFLSVQWESGNHPERLAKALRRYGAVFSAWDGSRLAGLVAAMDDGTMTGMCKRRYAGYLRIVLTSCREKVPFYERNGFLPDRTQEAVRLIPPTFGETGIEQEEGE